MYRLRLLRPEYEGRVRIAWKALSLELKNRSSTPKDIVDLEGPLMAEQEPELPLSPWKAPDWEYPVTLLPAFEALDCAIRQGEGPAWEFSWQVRKAFFDEGRCVSMRHVLVEVAREVGLDVERFERDWDSGAARPTIIAESHHGWEELKVLGSPTFVLPSGQQVHNPGALRVTWGAHHTIERVDPAERPWREAYRELLSAAAAGR